MTRAELQALRAVAEDAIHTSNLDELDDFAERGTRWLSDFGWTRMTRLLINLLPFTAAFSPKTCLALITEIEDLRERPLTEE